MSAAVERTKTCSICKQPLPVTAFHRRGHYVRTGIRAACRNCTREAAKKVRQAHPERLRTDIKKTQVRALTRSAIRAGVLSPKPCEACGDVRAEAHHPGYDGPDAHLTVVWLCDRHHAMEHGKRDWTRQLELGF